MAIPLSVAIETIRTLILATGWPILVVGSTYVLWLAVRFHRQVQGMAVARLVSLMVAGWLVSMYSLGVVATILMLRDPEFGVPLVLPVFGVWAVTMVAIVWATRRWLGESSTLHALYRRMERLVGERTAQLANEVKVRREAEQTLARHARELERSNRELEEFVHTASHDLQEPLRGISLFVQLLERKHGKEISDDAREYLQRVAASTTRMQGLIQDLLEYARLTQESPHAVITSAEAAFEEALKNLQTIIEETGAQVVHGPLPELRVNRAHLVQLWQNLIGNAIKFRRPDVPPHIEVTAEEEDARWHFCVRDNGIGIGVHERDTIFQVFRRLHDRDAYPGSGIGLATCKKIVELAGGDMWVESEPGSGSTFHFRMPTVGHGASTVGAPGATSRDEPVAWRARA